MAPWELAGGVAQKGKGSAPPARTLVQGASGFPASALCDRRPAGVLWPGRERRRIESLFWFSLVVISCRLRPARRRARGGRMTPEDDPLRKPQPVRDTDWPQQERA